MGIVLDSNEELQIIQLSPNYLKIKLLDPKFKNYEAVYCLTDKSNNHITHIINQLLKLKYQSENTNDKN